MSVEGLEEKAQYWFWRAETLLMLLALMLAIGWWAPRPVDQSLSAAELKGGGWRDRRDDPHASRPRRRLRRARGDA